MQKYANLGKLVAIFRKNVILELCKGVHCVDLGESFPTHIHLQNLASIQPRTSPLKFVGAFAGAALEDPGHQRERLGSQNMLLQATSI